MQTLEELNSIAYDIFKDNQERLGIKCEKPNDVGSCFEELIKKAYKKYNKPVVILIDEYDKPILDVIDNKEQSKINRNFLRGIYSVLKANDAYIRFAFLTGVTKFSKASIFSGLNNITDISLDEEYATICGYTQNDIETSFLPYLKDVDLERVKEWYNGYNFLGDKVYNPFDILLFIEKKFKFKSYWWESGSPYSLIELLKIKDYHLPSIQNLRTDETLLNSFDIENIQLESLLFQAGYLTIDRVLDDGFDTEYLLKVPNMEVQISLNRLILDYLTKRVDITTIKNIRNSLIDTNLENFKQTLTSLFASIPYNNYVKNNISTYEGYYASVTYAYLASLGLKIIAEDVTNRGRIDITLFIKDKIYIIEFKVGDTDALTQIKEKNYHQKYLNQNREIYLVGINFDEDEKNISEFLWEKIQ
jgi:hypothetical protein